MGWKYYLFFRRAVLVKEPEEIERQPVDVIPREFAARTLVHEYGGGAFSVYGNAVIFSNYKDQRLYRQDIGGNFWSRLFMKNSFLFVFFGHYLAVLRDLLHAWSPSRDRQRERERERFRVHALKERKYQKIPLSVGYEMVYALRINYLNHVLILFHALTHGTNNRILMPIKHEARFKIPQSSFVTWALKCLGWTAFLQQGNVLLQSLLILVGQLFGMLMEF